MENALEDCSKVSIFHYTVVQLESFFTSFVDNSNPIGKMYNLFKSLARIKNQVENSQVDPWKTMQDKTIKILERHFTEEPIDSERLKTIINCFRKVLDKIDKVVDGSIYRKKLDFVADLFSCVAEDIQSRLMSQEFNHDVELNLYYNDFVLKALIQYKPEEGSSSIDPNTQGNLMKADITDDQLNKVWEVYTAVADIYGLNVEQLVDYVRKKRERNDLRHFESKIKTFAKERKRRHQPVQLVEFVRHNELAELVVNSEVQLLESVFRMCWQTMLYRDQQKFTVHDFTHFNREPSTTVPLNAANPDDVKFAYNQTAILVLDGKQLKSFKVNGVTTSGPPMMPIRWLQGNIHEILAVENKNEFLLLTAKKLFLMKDDYSATVIIDFKNGLQGTFMTTGGSHIFIYFDNSREIKHFPEIKKYIETDYVKTTRIDNKYGRIYQMHLSSSHDFLAMTVELDRNTYRSIVIFNTNMQEIRCISDIVNLSVELAVPVNQWVALSDHKYYLIQMNGTKVSGPLSLRPLKLSQFNDGPFTVCQLLRDNIGQLRLSIH